MDILTREDTFLPPGKMHFSRHFLPINCHLSLKPQRYINSSSLLIKRTMTKENKRQYWLLKTEPNEWSWSDQESNAGISRWDGVKNRQAINNLKKMAIDDLCFFYHSGSTSRKVVGVVKVIKTWYDSEDGGAVDVRSVGEMRKAVDLSEIKGDKSGIFDGFVLLKQARLSVVPVEQTVWDKICEMGGGFGNSEGNEN